MCIERSLNGWDEQCLQCSYTREYKRHPVLEKEATLVALGTNTIRHHPGKH